jgi:uncharacterized protein YqgQ
MIETSLKRFRFIVYGDSLQLRTLIELLVRERRLNRLCKQHLLLSKRLFLRCNNLLQVFYQFSTLRVGFAV